MDGAVSTLVFGQFGSQAPSAADASAAARSFAGLWEGGDAPARLERGRFVDPAGNANVVWLAYWLDRDAYERWSASAEVTEFWRGLRVDGPAGYWREVSMIPRDHLDAIYSPPGCEGGAPTCSPGAPDMSAWGGVLDMGDRTEPLHPELAAFIPTRVETRRRRIHLDGPGNLCLIRSGPERDRGLSLSRRRPLQEGGLDTLIAHPANGCIASRRVHEQSVRGLDGEQTYTIAWFLSLTHLLEWTRGYNGHLLIYASFFRTVAGRDAASIDRDTWHEVSVLPRGYVVSDYVNCHNRTGLLPLLDSAVELALAREVHSHPDVGRDGLWTVGVRRAD